MNRKRYPLEFKIEAVKRLENRGTRPASEVAEALGVAESQLYAWRRQHGKASREVNGKSESLEEECVRLRRSNQELRRDREALLKSIAVFAKDRK